MPAKCVMVLGTSSGAGKSWVSTALCRWYARQGYKVAPFKAQNMSNNARVVNTRQSSVTEFSNADQASGEIGSAQYFQALAANAEPNVNMNPVLLKPEADTRSQVILLGKVNTELSTMSWRERSEKIWPHIQQSLDYLIAENDVLVIEGAGSPAEINLMASDIVNLRVARYANAQCILITDIDRGGAFAHLYGTWALLPKPDQQRIKGFLLNKFRGDPTLLAPAPEQLKSLTGIPIIGTIPMLFNHGLPEEDGIFDERTLDRKAGALKVAVLVYPRISNLDEFQPLKNITDLELIWARQPSSLEDVDWIILPGSKQTSADLAWLKQCGFERVIEKHIQRGKMVLGICGGLQMLGQVLHDPFNIDGAATGLGHLAIQTTFAKDKQVNKITVRFGQVKGLWSALSYLEVFGYEIHHGKSSHKTADNEKQALMAQEIIADLAWQNSLGNVLGIYIHGLFEDPAVIKSLFGKEAKTLDTVFNNLADLIGHHIPKETLLSLVE
ncbi:cobyric acid synthase [Polynucleobacter sp. IMCC 30228]|uniref:cobyric acid synthase n=1 Tax=Polynucleobacter sp. IMCC 30228 TaxID=2781011 RepID=UPI001F2CB03D|nr:cobyric acid synthase [Polynucleobacter sp. IMCC 30228]MCE7528149.1 cobyric acid synthase [Polynucleobacter sp. IMCC 30228]